MDFLGLKGRSFNRKGSACRETLPVSDSTERLLSPPFSMKNKMISLTAEQKEWIFPFFVYLVIVVTAYHRVHELYDSDFAYIILILIAFCLGRLSSLIRDWTPIVLLLFSYEYLHGYADKIIGKVHSTDVIYWEEKLFGTPVWTVRLQQWFYTPGHAHWYDYACGIIYYGHSFIALFVAFGLWLYRRDLFRIWVRIYVYLSFAGFITYVLFPAMPPWMASQLHLIPSIHKIIDEVMPDGTVGVVSAMTSNLVAAMPSLHAAFPAIGFFFMLKYFRKGAIPYALYSLSVFFAIVYLGEHYLLDTVAGIGYAAAVFYIDDMIISWRARVKSKEDTQLQFEVPVTALSSTPSWPHGPILEPKTVRVDQTRENRA